DAGAAPRRRRHLAGSREDLGRAGRDRPARHRRLLHAAVLRHERCADASAPGPGPAPGALIPTRAAAPRAGRRMRAARRPAPWIELRVALGPAPLRPRPPTQTLQTLCQAQPTRWPATFLIGDTP